MKKFESNRLISDIPQKRGFVVGWVSEAQPSISPDDAADEWDEPTLDFVPQLGVPSCTPPQPVGLR